MDTKELEKLARKLADNSTRLHSDSFKINTGNSQGNELVLVVQLQDKIASLESEQRYAENIAEEDVTEIEIILIQHQGYITRKMKHERLKHKKYNKKNNTKNI